tara:strand:+ start:2889 stop:3464 length:576 start_codon:yes stop_codon:yes gene_type:complete
MPNLIIKPQTGTGNSVILQDQAGGAVLTTADSGATLASTNVFPTGTIRGWNHTVTAPTTSQGTDASYTLLTGSSVDYTPTTGSSYVVYEYTTTFTHGDASSLFQIWFNHDSSNVALTNVSWYGAVANSNAGWGYKNFRYIIPSWTGSKNCKLTYRIYDANLEGSIHEVKHSGDGTGTDVFVNIYRTTYSVM